MVNPVVAVPIYGVCPEGYIKHEGYPVLGVDGRPVPSPRGWSGMVDDPDGSVGLILFAAFLPERVTGGEIIPLGRTFAENLGQAAAVICSFPPVYPKIEHFRARHMRVVSDTAIRADVFFPQWLLATMLGRKKDGGSHSLFR
jgi:hypothetical protein